MIRRQGLTRRTARGYSATVTLGILIGLLILPFATRLLPLDPPLSETPLPYLALDGHTGWVNCVAYSPDGQYLATGSDDGTAIVWDAATGQSLVTLRGHTDAVDPVAFARYGKYLVTGSLDGTARLWSIPDGRCLAIMAGEGEPLYDLCVLPGPEPRGLATWRLLTAGANGHLKLWGLPGGELLADYGRRAGEQPAADFVAVAPYDVDGMSYVDAWFAGNRQDSQLMGDRSRTNRHPGLNIRSANRMFPALTTRCRTPGMVTAVERCYDYGVAGCANGLILVAGGTGGSCLTPATVDDHFVLTGHHARIESLDFSVDGRRLASAASDNTVRVWDLASRQCIAVLRTAADGLHQDWIERHSLAFSPDGQRLATAQGYIARIYELP